MEWGINIRRLEEENLQELVDQMGLEPREWFEVQGLCEDPRFEGSIVLSIEG